jgi:hypothetical protein
MGSRPAGLWSARNANVRWIRHQVEFAIAREFDIADLDLPTDLLPEGGYRLRVLRWLSVVPRRPNTFINGIRLSLSA